MRTSQTEAEAARNAYYAWRHKHPRQVELLEGVPADVVARLWADAWQAGAWDGIRRNAQLGLNLVQIVERLEELARIYARALEELARIYADKEMERAFEQELAQASAYWKGEFPRDA